MRLPYASLARLAPLALLMPLIASCSDEDVPVQSMAQTVVGETKTVGSGTAQTWVRLDGSGHPTSVGVTLSESAMNGLRASGFGPSTDILIPTTASQTAFNHVGLDWNPMGHEPEHVYDLPHFDVHFYMISTAERNGITATGADTVKINTLPPVNARPAGYIPLPGGIPRMGRHWANPASAELHGATFTQTLIYGSYDGRMTFIEPMITRAYLQSNPDMTAAIPQPSVYPVAGRYYPTSYAIHHDAAAHTYVVSLDGLTLR